MKTYATFPAAAGLRGVLLVGDSLVLTVRVLLEKAESHGPERVLDRQ